jgi:hypothetical protein
MKQYELKSSYNIKMPPPRWDLEFHVHSDASNVAVGAMVAQKPLGKYNQPIYYATRLVNFAEHNYTMTKKEALVMVFALNKYRHYLLWNKFVSIY